MDYWYESIVWCVGGAPDGLEFGCVCYAQAVCGVVGGENIPAVEYQHGEVRDVRKVNILIVIACSLTMRAKHCADMNAGTYISHLAVRISSCTPIQPSSGKLLALREIRVDLFEIRFGEISELIFKKVIHISD